MTNKPNAVADMHCHIANLAQSLNAHSREIRLLPAGRFRSNDGRPVGLPSWNIDRTIAERVIADASSRDEMVIDFEHQSLLAKQNGLPAPAAGWIKRLLWRDGDGLFAVDVNWTNKARAMLASGEYRFISPLFIFDGSTGDVQRLLGAGLTNTPGLTGLTDLSKVAVNSRRADSTPVDSQHSIESFNRVFGGVGVFHHDTPPGRIADLTGTGQKPKLPADLDSQQREMMRRLYPNTFAPD